MGSYVKSYSPTQGSGQQKKTAEDDIDVKEEQAVVVGRLRHIYYLPSNGSLEQQLSGIIPTTNNMHLHPQIILA